MEVVDMMNHFHNVLEVVDNVVEREVDIGTDDDHEVVGNMGMGWVCQMELEANVQEEDRHQVGSHVVYRRREVDMHKVEEHFGPLEPKREDLHPTGRELLEEWHLLRLELPLGTFLFVGECFADLDLQMAAEALVQCLILKSS
jgi:hypothetical protein